MGLKGILGARVYRSHRATPEGHETPTGLTRPPGAVETVAIEEGMPSERVDIGASVREMPEVLPALSPERCIRRRQVTTVVNDRL